MIVAIDQFDKSCWLIGNIAARRQIRMKLGFPRDRDVTCNNGSRRLRMRLRPSLLLLGALFLVAGMARAVDRGQFENVPDHIRAWFKAMRSPDGASCCDICDRHRTNYEVRAGRY